MQLDALKFTPVKLVQLAKALSPILVTPFPIVMEVKFVQYSKALAPMCVILFHPMVMEVKEDCLNRLAGI